MRTFCCCIPVRLGALILAPITAVVAALLAYTQLYLLINHQSQYDTFEKAIRGALAGITILIALSSIFGFIGSLLARRKMVSFYSNMLWIGLLIFVVLGGIDLWQLFSHRDSTAQRCETNVNAKTQDLQSFFGISIQSTQDDACKKLATTTAIVVTVLFAILVLILMWLIGIVTKYKHQLQHDASHKFPNTFPPSRQSHRFGNIGKSSNSYQAAETREVDEAGTGLLHTTPPPHSKHTSYPHAAYQHV